jgi:hypothetical protein
VWHSNQSIPEICAHYDERIDAYAALPHVFEQAFLNRSY